LYHSAYNQAKARDYIITAIVLSLSILSTSIFLSWYYVSLSLLLYCIRTDISSPRKHRLDKKL